MLLPDEGLEEGVLLAEAHRSLLGSLGLEGVAVAGVELILLVETVKLVHVVVLRAGLGDVSWSEELTMTESLLAVLLGLAQVAATLPLHGLLLESRRLLLAGEARVAELTHREGLAGVDLVP